MHNLDDSCSICFEIFTDPVFLPCKHTFCRNCIITALNKHQNCPICRRLICNQIGSEFPALGSPPTMEHEHKGYPTFIYEIAIALKTHQQFNFFEKRYLTMINEALNKELTFLIDPEYNDFCMKVKLVECIPIHDREIYICAVQSVQRGKLKNATYRTLPNTPAKLKYAEIDSVEDEPSNEAIELYRALLQTINDLILMLQLQENDVNRMKQMFAIGQPLDHKLVSEKSLELLASIHIDEEAFFKLFYGTDLHLRMSIIKKHYDSILNYHSNK